MDKCIRNLWVLFYNIVETYWISSFSFDTPQKGWSNSSKRGCQCFEIQFLAVLPTISQQIKTSLLQLDDATLMLKFKIIQSSKKYEFIFDPSLIFSGNTYAYMLAFLFGIWCIESFLIHQNSFQLVSYWRCFYFEWHDDDMFWELCARVSQNDTTFEMLCS